MKSERGNEGALPRLCSDGLPCQEGGMWDGVG